MSTPIPTWTKPPVDVPVQSLRDFVAAHGPDIAVLVTWTHETASFQFVTIGSTQFFADSAVKLREMIADHLGLNPLGPTTEDLRGDHPNLSLNDDEMNFLIWILEFMSGEATKRDEKFQEYIKKYHDVLIERLAQAKRVLENKPE